MAKSATNVYRLAMAMLLVLVLVGGLALLMSLLRGARRSQFLESLEKDLGPAGRQAMRSEWRAAPAAPAAGEERPAPARAVIKTFDAEIELTPRLSVGTASPESIYEASMQIHLEARSPDGDPRPCRILLPVPPRLISLSDLTVAVNDDPSENVLLEGNYLVWEGQLDDEEPADVQVTYTAVGKGIFRLEKPPGKIIERFHARLTAHSSDIRMLALSLQPSSTDSQPNATVYTWEYDRLLVAKPIELDVLGIAAVDRLGDLGWLGPVSVLIFGLLISLVALSSKPEALTVWVLILIVGCFAAAYPFMYFLQEFLPLRLAMGATAAGVILVILLRCWSLFGFRLGLFGGLILPAAVMALTLAAAVYTKPAMQGMLLTGLGLLTLVVAMSLLPRVQRRMAVPAPALQGVPPAPAPPRAEPQGPPTPLGPPPPPDRPSQPQ